MMKTVMMLAVLAAVAISVSACNTVKGMGQDLTGASNAVQQRM